MTHKQARVRQQRQDQTPQIHIPHSSWSRVERNLAYIAEQGFILDFNLRGFDKAIEQYPSLPVLKLALQ